MKEICKKNESEDSHTKDYDMNVHKALVKYFKTTLEGLREPETLDEFQVRGAKYRAELQEYGRKNVAKYETLLVVTHSRMVNAILDTITKDETGRHQWGTRAFAGGCFIDQI